jgi:signal transduction histidine kinase
VPKQSSTDDVPVDRYVGILAHDVRNPVAALRAHAQMGQRQARRGDTEGVQRRLETIVQHADLVTDLLDAFVEAARVSAGRLELRPEPVELTQVLSAAREHALRRVGQLAPRPVAVVGEDGVVGQWDRDRLERASRALIENALIYGEPTQPVEIRVECGPDEVLVRVRDGGPGPSPDEAERVFERFFRGRSATQIDYVGPGLGLFTARGIARAHGGDVRLDPATSADAFVLELPLRPGILAVRADARG